MKPAPLAPAIVLLAAAAAAADPASDPDPQAHRHAEPALVAETTALIPGRTNRLAISFKIDPGWHLYWNGQNDTGLPPSFELSLPDGFTAHPVQWPAPERYVLPGEILDHVYHNRVTFIIPVDVPADAKGQATVSAKIDWLVCKDMCIPEDAEVTLTLPIAGSGENPTPSVATGLFKQADARLPKPPPRDVNITRSGDQVTVSVPGATHLAFFPVADAVSIVNPIEHGQATGDRLRFTTHSIDPEITRLAGVLEVKRSPDVPAVYYSIEDPLPHPGQPDPDTPRKDERP